MIAESLPISWLPKCVISDSRSGVRDWLDEKTSGTGEQNYLFSFNYS